MGQPVVVLPALVCTQALFDPLFKALPDHEIICGDTFENDSVEAMAAATLARAPASFALMGVSMGGYVAMEMIRQAPERINALILISTNAKSDSLEMQRTRAQQCEIAAKGGYGKIIRAQFPSMFAQAQQGRDDLRQCHRAMAEAVGVQGFVNQQKAIAARPASLETLSGFAAPCCLIHGGEDIVTPYEMMDEMHAVLPGSQLQQISGAGHLCLLEKPREVAFKISGILSS